MLFRRYVGAAARDSVALLNSLVLLFACSASPQPPRRRGTRRSERFAGLHTVCGQDVPRLCGHPRGASVQGFGNYCRRVSSGVREELDLRFVLHSHPQGIRRRVLRLEF